MNDNWHQVKIYKRIPRRLKAQVIQLWTDCFEEGLTPEQIAEQEDKFYSKHFLHIFAIKSGQVIGTVNLTRRIVDFAGDQVILGGIGGVCTQAEYRNRGLAHDLLTRGMEELKKVGLEVAFLVTDPGNAKTVRMYSRFGFERLARPYTFLGKSGKRYVEKDGFIAPLNSRNKFELIKNSNETLDLGQGNW